MNGDPNVKLGDDVKQGDILGYVGNTGKSTGNHLHYGERQTDGNTPKKPSEETSDYYVNYFYDYL